MKKYFDKNGMLITIGVSILVDQTEDTLDFGGTVVGFRDEFVSVEDQEENVFDVLEADLELEF